MPEEQEVAIEQLNDDLNKIHTWSNKNALMLNPIKTTALLVGTERKRSQVDLDDKIMLNNINVLIKENCKNLGVTLDKNLCFSYHVNNLVKVAYARLRTLYKFKYVISTPVKLKLTESLILSLFAYCDVVYGPCLSAHDMHRIQVVQNTCMRFSANVRRREHITPYFTIHGWNKMKVRRDIHFSCLTQKIITNNKPLYLREKIVFAQDIQERNRRNEYLLCVPQHRTTAFRGSFSYYSASIYNSLPNHIKSINNPFSFKIKIKRHFSNFI